MEVIMADFILLDEDFSDFPIGEFPYDKNHSAMGEYHFIHRKLTLKAAAPEDSFVSVICLAMASIRWLWLSARKE